MENTKDSKGGSLPWKKESLLNWVDRLPPAWSTETIQNWTSVFTDDVDLFATRKNEVTGDFDTEMLVGQAGHHAGQSWIGALKNEDCCHNAGKMGSTLRCFEAKPIGYFDGSASIANGGIVVQSIDGREWFTSDGNHRTVIAKFAIAMAEQITRRKHLMPKVKQRRYFVDFELQQQAHALRSLIARRQIRLEVKVSKVSLSSGEPSGHDLFFAITDHRFRSLRGDIPFYFHLDKRGLLEFVSWLDRTNGVVAIADRLRYRWDSVFRKERRLHPQRNSFTTVASGRRLSQVEWKPWVPPFNER